MHIIPEQRKLLLKPMEIFCLIILVLSLLFLSSCKYKQSPPPPNYNLMGELPPVDTTVPRVNIIWDKIAKKVSHAVYFAEYGRIKRLDGDTILLTYHCGSKENEWDNIALRKSADNGKTWSPAQIIVPDNDPHYNGFSTPDLSVLKNGWLLLAYSGRGIPDDSTHNNLQVRISKDKGETWGGVNIVALGRCWEPGIVQLPDGEIQLFFSNEILSSKGARFRYEQKVMMITSRNNGISWSVPKMVAFTPGCRDGMPVPIILKDNKGIVFPIEAVYNKKSPEILWASMKARWNYKGVGTVKNGRRWYGGVNPIWGGAPYRLQLPTGETVISMQTEGGRSIDRYREWKNNTMLVMVGNSMAKNFSNISRPYPNLPEDHGAYFSSLFLKNDSTLVLVSTRTFPDKNSGIYWKEGHILGPIIAKLSSYGVKNKNIKKVKTF